MERVLILPQLKAPGFVDSLYGRLDLYGGMDGGWVEEGGGGRAEGEEGGATMVNI